MTHSQQRLNERILTADTVQVAIEGATAQYAQVGTFTITAQMKEAIEAKLDELEAAKIPANKSYGICLYKFQLNSNTVNFTSPKAKEAAKGKTLVITGHKSNGNDFYAIVRGGNVTTDCFVKSYTGFGTIADKLRVDYTPKNIKNIR